MILGPIKFCKGPIKISNGQLKFGNLHVFEWDMGHWPILRAHHHFWLGLTLVKGRWAKFCLSEPKINEIYVASDVEGFLGSVEEHESDDSIDSVESKPWITDVRVDWINVTFKVYSGADVTVILDKELERFSGVKL